MVKSLFTGVTGLKSHQQRMDVIGNNIANVNTIGYKTDVVTFADVYYQTKRSPSAATGTLGGINPRQVGYGVKVSAVTANLSQSGYNYTDSKTDIALDGNGFFQLMDGAGNIYYTRAGNFSFDDAGYLVNADGYHVLGVTGESDGVAPGSDIIRAIIPATDNHVSSATKKVNGTNVTVSVSAPSEYTNMTVSFQQANFPYATYANNVLTIFFDKEAQYNSQEDFNQAIQTALTAGGINLPDDVEVTIDFDPIPNDITAQKAGNTVDNLNFSSDNSAVRFRVYKEISGSPVNAYIDFNIRDNTNTEMVTLGKATGDKVVVSYSASGNATATPPVAKGWTVLLTNDATVGDINAAIKDYMNANPTLDVPKLNCTSFVVPSDFSKAQVIDALVATPDATTGLLPNNFMTGSPAQTASQKMYGATNVPGLVDFGVIEAGEFANNYRIQFAYNSGYGRTSASWEENTLTINVCVDTTLADINNAVREVAGSNSKRLIRFYDISGIDYGEPRIYTNDNGDTVFEFAKGFTATIKNGTTAADWTDRNGTTIDAADILARWKEAFGDDATLPTLTAATATAAGTSTNNPTKAIEANASATPPVTAEDALKYNNEVIWNPEVRKAFFGDNPAVSPMDGEDAFYTKTAKSMSTFLLQDGRLGEDQSMHNFEDYMIQSDGTIIGLHKIYGYINIGRVDIATFDNPNGLAKAGGTNFRQTVASGPAFLNRPGEDGAGMIVSNALEMSNVDLADEFTNMIATQRGYQANSRVVTVSDTMIEELLNLKR